MKKNKNICVYTCITGSYDKLKELKTKEKGIDYICFTNNKTLISKTWKVIYLRDNLKDILLARRTKILGHKYLEENYDFTVWIDASMVINKSIWEFINKYDLLNYSFSGFVHGERNCIYKEAEKCIEYIKDDVEIIEQQMKKYKTEGFPKNYGLIESTILFRKINDPLVKKTMEVWFSELLNGSFRDQLSFNYAIYKTGLNWNKIPLKVFDNDYFTYEGHIGRNFDYYKTKYEIYYDYGNGFNDKYDATGLFKCLDGKFIINLKVPKDVIRVRIDPIKDNVCVFHNIIVKSKKKKIDYQVISKEILNSDKRIFFYINPKIIFNVDREDKNIFVEISFAIVDSFTLYSYFEEYDLGLNEKYIELINSKTSKTWKLFTLIRKIADIFKK